MQQVKTELQLQVTELKVLREAQSIKAIQVIDRGGEGVPESFMKGALHQVAKKPVLSIESSEKKDGCEIQRGRIADNIRMVYYRDESGGKLRAFVLWTACSSMMCKAVFLLNFPEFFEPLLNEEINILPADGAGMRRDQYVGLLPERRSGSQRLPGKDIQPGARERTILEGD